MGPRTQEFGKYDNEPSKYIRQLSGIHQRSNQPWQCDVAYERFLGPEVFFQPEIYTSDYLTPLPEVVDQCIQVRDGPSLLSVGRIR